jgi:hypothetical protein
VIAVVPRWKDEFVDRSLHHAIMAAQRNMAPNYRLDEREALVVVAELPPPARYFGQTNVFTRETTLNPNDPIYQRVTDPAAAEHSLRHLAEPVAHDDGREHRQQHQQRRHRAAVRGGLRPAALLRHHSRRGHGGGDDRGAAAGGRPTADHVFTEPVSPDWCAWGWGARRTT